MKLYLTQHDIDDMIEDLVYQIEELDKRKWSRVVGIANGGLPVSKPLAEALGLFHESVRISHYDEKILRDTPIIEGQLSQPTNNLIVDDLIDEGWTINTFNKHFGLEGNAVAVLLWNPVGPKPDFYVEKKPDAWITFPWNEDWHEKDSVDTRQIRTC